MKNYYIQYNHWDGYGFVTEDVVIVFNCTPKCVRQIEDAVRRKQGLGKEKLIGIENITLL